MTNAEVGLYIRLLCLQAEHGSVPDDVERIAAAFGPSCRAIWSVVRSKFAPGPVDGSLVNERMTEVLMARDAFRERQRAKGIASASKRIEQTTAKPRPNHGSTVVEPLGDGVKSIEEKERAKYPDDFMAFFKAYPEKKAKAVALKAWEKLRASERALCQPAIEAQLKAKHFRGKDGQDYFPHCATWLNGRRWEDELSTYTPNSTTHNGGMTKEQADEEMRQIRIKYGRDPDNGWVGDEECSRALLIYMGRIKERKA